MDMPTNNLPMVIIHMDIAIDDQPSLSYHFTIISLGIYNQINLSNIINIPYLSACIYLLITII